MRRALAMLKYLPAVLCGMLLTAWVVSELLIWLVVVRTPWAEYWISIDDGSLQTHYPTFAWNEEAGWWHHRLYWKEPPRTLLGRFENLGRFDRRVRIKAIPMPFVMALLLPLAIGCLTRFRFPLWSYFAWTALVAAELTYYLR